MIDSISSTLYTTDESGVPVRATGYLSSKEVLRCKNLDRVTLIKYSGNTKCFKVVHGDVVGYIHRSFLASDSAAVQIVTNFNSENDIIDTFDYVSPNQRPSQTTETISTSSSTSTPSKIHHTSTPSYSTPSRSYTPSRTYHTGPRGGTYYYNSKGNKTYRKK